MELEFESIGYYADKLTNVCWYETFENPALRRAAVVTHYVKPISCKRDRAAKGNKVKFQLEEGETYPYSRHICITPRQEESRCFRVVDNEIEFLEEELANPHLAYSARGFEVMGTNEPSNRVRCVEVQPRRRGSQIEVVAETWASRSHCAPLYSSSPR